MSTLELVDRATGWLGIVIMLVEIVMWGTAGGSGKARRGIEHISRYPTWFRALLPFMWIGCVFNAASLLFHVAVEIQTDELSVLMTVICVGGALYWSYTAHDWYRRWKNTDDDFWKKKRAKAVGKIKEVAGKLVVVPELEPIPVRA